MKKQKKEENAQCIPNGQKKKNSVESIIHHHEESPNMVKINYPNGATGEMSFKHFSEMEWKAEEYDCIQMYLDDLNAPIFDDSDNGYKIKLSVVGRIDKLIKK